MRSSWEGRVLNERYEIEALLGHGGMGMVFKGWDAKLERYVCLKVIHEHLTLEDTFLKRFKTEAAALANFDHPSIVKVSDYGVDEDTPYIVMQLLEGQTR